MPLMKKKNTSVWCLNCNAEVSREPDKLRIFVNYALKMPEYECLSNFIRIIYCCHFSAYARGFVLFHIYESCFPGHKKPGPDTNNSLQRIPVDA